MAMLNNQRVTFRSLLVLGPRRPKVPKVDWLTLDQLHVASQATFAASPNATLAFAAALAAGGLTGTEFQVFGTTM